MTTSTLTENQLPAETAVASRLLREGYISGPLACWLHKPSSVGKCESESFMVAAAMEEIIAAVSKDTEPWQKAELRNASLWYAKGLELLCSRGPNFPRWCSQEFADRLALAALLPLYRCLATESLAEGWGESRQRLCEALTLRGLHLELGNELESLLEGALRGQADPHAGVLQHLSIDLTVVAGIVMDCAALPEARQASADSSEFSDDIKSWLASLEPKDFATQPKAWSEPGVLWKLAGELLTEKSNMVLPRSWAAMPIPWSSIGQHWRKLQSLLVGGSAPTKQAEERGSAAKDSQRPASAESTAVSSGAPTGESAAAQSIEANLSGTHPDAELRNAGKAEALVNATQDLVDRDVAGLDDPDSAPSVASIAQGSAPDEVDAGQDASSPDNDGTVADPKDRFSFDDPSASNRISVSEIHSHNDPIFISALAQTIAACRTESRPLSVATIVVRPENPDDEVDACRRCQDGLYLWQRKTVSWLADCPDLDETNCFVTADGEMMVTILDHDRNEATTILRQGLIEVLTGEAFDDGNSLARVELPVRFHAGIATVARAGAGFSPEQITEPLRRCFTAATRLGSATIKSIEVY